MKEDTPAEGGDAPTPRDHLEYVGLLAVSGLLRLFPRKLALALGAGLGQAAWVLGIRKRMVLANLGHALPDLPDSELRRLGARSARNMGRTVAEFIRFAGRDRERVASLVELRGEDELRSTLEEGNGALVLTGHLGAWSLYVTALAARGIPSSLLVGRQRNPRVDRFILGIPGDTVQFISKGRSSPRGILRGLKKSEAVVMVADHYYSPESYLTDFLGRPASTLPLPGLIVARYRVPLFLMAGHRAADGRHRVNLRRISVPDTDDEETLSLQVGALFNRELGDEVLQYPDQYFWYHDRWKSRRGRRASKKL